MPPPPPLNPSPSLGPVIDPRLNLDSASIPAPSFEPRLTPDPPLYTMNRVSKSYKVRQSRAEFHQIFGTGKAKPKPSLTDAISSVSLIYDRILLSDHLQTDSRVASLEVKLKKLDAELSVFKTQMSKMREGPGKAAVQQRALRVLKQKRMYESQLGQLQQQTYNMEQAAMTTENLKNTVSI